MNEKRMPPGPDSPQDQLSPNPILDGRPVPSENSSIGNRPMHEMPVDPRPRNVHNASTPSCHFTASFSFSSVALAKLTTQLSAFISNILDDVNTVFSTSPPVLYTPNFAAFERPLAPDTARIERLDVLIPSVYSSIKWILSRTIKQAIMTDQEIVFSVGLIEKIFFAYHSLLIGFPPRPTGPPEIPPSASPSASYGRDFTTARIATTRPARPASRVNFVLTNDNYGTIIVCAMILSIKYLRDKPFSNTCWAETFAIPVQTLNQSELIVCSLLNFDLTVALPILEQHFRKFILNQ